MTSYTLSARCKRDIQSIVKSSVQDFGDVQTLNYMHELERVLQFLAHHRDCGRSFLHRRTGEENRYYTCVSHVVYYRIRKEDIFIVRILHGKMLPENHL